LALVEEYQHLINGNPDALNSSAGQCDSSSNNGGMLDVLSPEVSMSEGQSPIRMENQASTSQNASQESKRKLFIYSALFFLCYFLFFILFII